MIMHASACAVCIAINFCVMVRELGALEGRKTFKYERKPYSSRVVGWNNRGTADSSIRRSEFGSGFYYLTSLS